MSQTDNHAGDINPVRDLYHIAPNKVRYIATEQSEIISHSRSEYIA